MAKTKKSPVLNPKRKRRGTVPKHLTPQERREEMEKRRKQLHPHRVAIAGVVSTADKKKKTATEPVIVSVPQKVKKAIATISKASVVAVDDKSDSDFPVEITVKKEKPAPAVTEEGKKDFYITEPKGHIQFRFDEEQLVDMYTYSSRFREIAKSGRYVYAAGMLLLYHPDCIRSGDDINSMKVSADAAKTPYKYSLVGEQSSYAIYMNKPGTENKEPKKIPKSKYYGKLIFGNPEKYGELSQLTANPAVITEDLLQLIMKACTGGGSSGGGPTGTGFDDGDESEGSHGNINIGDGDTPSNMLRYIIKSELDRQNMSIKEFAKYLGISDRTISRFWTEPESRPDLCNVIAVCVGLHFPPTTSELILQLTGYWLREIPQEQAYRALINVFYTQDIHVCNRILIHEGLEAMTPAT